MKICIISRNINNDYTGSFEFDQAKALKNAGCDVYVLSLDLRSIRRKRKLGIYKETYKGIEILRCSIPVGAINKKVFHKIGCTIFKKGYLRLKKEAGDFDIIHSHFLDVSYICAYTLRSIMKDETTLIVTEHSSKLNDDRKNMEQDTIAKAEYVYSHADKVISVSESLAEKIEKNFHVKCEVIYNVFDSDIFKYSAKKQTNKDKFVFVSTGNLTKNKRMDLLIECFGRAFEEEAALYIFGEGAEKDNLIDLIKRQGLSEKVFLMGRKSRREIAEFYRQADAFVLLSEKETFGVAYIEALAMGLPVIACNSGGPGSFVNDKIGVLTDDSKEDIIKTLIFIKENRDEYDGKYISDYIGNLCGSEAIAENIKGIYDEITKGEVHG